MTGIRIMHEAVDRRLIWSALRFKLLLTNDLGPSYVVCSWDSICVVENHNESSTYPKSFSIASIIAVIAAILTFTSGSFLGMDFALFAIASGLLGITLAVSPRKRGGVASTFAIVGGMIGVIGVLDAMIKAILWIL